MTNDKITKFYLTFLKRPHIFVAFSEYINFSILNHLFTLKVLIKDTYLG